MAALAVLLVMFLVLPAYLAAPVSTALFRLQASTQLAHMRTDTATAVSLRVSNWEFVHVAADSSGAGTSVVSSRLTEPSDVAVPDLITIQLEPGDQITLRQLAAGKARFTFAMPARPIEVDVQLSEKSVLVRKDGNGVESAETEAGSATRLYAIGQEGALLRFTVATVDEDVAGRFRVNELGFGVLANDGVFAGLLGGQLLFFDKPDTTLRLYRGADLQLGEVDAEISAIVLDADGIQIEAQGLTEDAFLQIALRQEASRERSVLPTRLDALRADPVVAVLIGFLSVLAAVAGLLFAVGQVVPAVGKWLRGLRTYL